MTNSITNTTPNHFPAAYSVNAFIAKFNIGRTKTYEEINNGRLKARKIGTRTIIAHDDAMVWFNSLPVKNHNTT